MIDDDKHPSRDNEEQVRVWGAGDYCKRGKSRESWKRLKMTQRKLNTIIPKNDKNTRKHKDPDRFSIITYNVFWLAEVVLSCMWTGAFCTEKQPLDTQIVPTLLMLWDKIYRCSNM